MRTIARLDVKSGHLIKGIRFEGLRKIGDPGEFAERYYLQGVDELLLIDTVASLYGRSQVAELVESVSANTFVPLTVGGGISSIKEAERMFKLGADKVALNTAGFGNPTLFSEISSAFGSQSLVGSIHAKESSSGWECMIEQGRERTGMNVFERLRQLIDLGVGEILLTSVDKDGTKLGFDLDLVGQALELSSVPIVVGGGCGSLDHLSQLIGIGTPSGVAIATAFHYGNVTVSEAKDRLST